MGWRYWGDYERRPLRRPANGIRAQTQRGKFGQTWWAGRWIAALERLVDSGRLSRGRSYARGGQVVSLEVGSEIKAKVQGTMPSPYTVTIRFAALSDTEWDTVVRSMAAEAIYAAKLLAGEMPAEIERVFEAAGTALFPTTGNDLVMHCSCPDWVTPCKHTAAVHYLLGERFDSDPFLMFQLRGRTRDQITEALRSLRTDGIAAAADMTEPSEEEVDAEPPEPLPVDDPERFWNGDVGAIPALHYASPALDALPLRRLGPPPFAGGREDFVSALEGAYRAIAADAHRRVLGS